MNGLVKFLEEKFLPIAGKIAAQRLFYIIIYKNEYCVKSAKIVMK